MLNRKSEKMIDIGEMQSGFMLGKGTIDAIFIARQQLDE